MNTNIIKFITHTMKKWITRIFLPHKNGCIESTDITFLRGIFQGDTFLSSIFCLALAPIRNILKRDDVGHRIMNEQVSNLMYIDDLKVANSHNYAHSLCIQYYVNHVPRTNVQHTDTKSTSHSEIISYYLYDSTLLCTTNHFT